MYVLVVYPVRGTKNSVILGVFEIWILSEPLIKLMTLSAQMVFTIIFSLFILGVARNPDVTNICAIRAISLISGSDKNHNHYYTSII
jgi:hypothetical protein